MPLGLILKTACGKTSVIGYWIVLSCCGSKPICCSKIYTQFRCFDVQLLTRTPSYKISYTRHLRQRFSFFWSSPVSSHLQFYTVKDLSGAPSLQFFEQLRSTMNETNEEKKMNYCCCFIFLKNNREIKKTVLLLQFTCIAFFSFHYLLLNALHVDIWVMATQSSSLKHLSLLLWLFSSAPCPPHDWCAWCKHTCTFSGCGVMWCGFCNQEQEIH